MVKFEDKLDGPLPLELQMDLLVDEELPEERRRALLASLDREPGKWRELSIRFLERQVERKSVRDLIAGGRLVPVPDEAVEPYKFPRTAWFRSTRMAAVAAGLLIAVGSALVTGYWVQHLDDGRNVVAGNAEMVRANLPGEAVGLPDSVPVDVPIVNDKEASFFPTVNNGSSRRAVVIQPDGKGNAMVIPVSTLPVSVY